MKSTRQKDRLGRAVASLATAVVLGAWLASCHQESSRPDVLLVTIDTLRADHCSAYGYPLPTTPTLEHLAAGGVRYARAYAESSTTAPSHSVLMTGRHFRTLGVTKNGAVLPPDATTLAEAFQAGGYATAAFVSSFPLMQRFGFSQGFDNYDDAFVMDEASLGRRKPGELPHDRLAGATREHLERWLGSQSIAKPLFVWLHFVDPHAPYHAPEKFVAKWPPGTGASLQRYDAEVHYADEQLGLAIAALEKQRPGRERLIVVTSDHGEGLGDHGWMSHGINLHEEAVRVPLIAKWPGHLPEGHVEEEAVGIIDIAPGLLHMAGIDAKGFDHGRDLFAPPDASRSIFLQRRDYKSAKEQGVTIGGEMTAVVSGGTKLILAPGEDRRELYDVKADPHELTDLLAGPGGKAAPAAAGAARKKKKPMPAAPPPPAPSMTPAESETTAKRLEQLLADWHQAFPAATKKDALEDKETLKALRSLGYVD